MRNFAAIAVFALLIACAPQNKDDNTQDDGPEAVDLGIVVNGKKIKWRTCNIGASKPEEYGDYYAWGETVPKDDYCWDSYKWCNGSRKDITKYNNLYPEGIIDNKTVLEIGIDGDDVASKTLGDKWRIPTEEEWIALIDNCTWTWTSSYNDSGVAGQIVTSNVQGYEDKSIFLPAAGYRNSTNSLMVDVRGFYWSSSLNVDAPYAAWYVYFISDAVGSVITERFIGFSIRPVTD